MHSHPLPCTPIHSHPLPSTPIHSHPLPFTPSLCRSPQYTPHSLSSYYISTTLNHRHYILLPQPATSIHYHTIYHYHYYHTIHLTVSHYIPDTLYTIHYIPDTLYTIHYTMEFDIISQSSTPRTVHLRLLTFFLTTSQLHHTTTTTTTTINTTIIFTLHPKQNTHSLIRNLAL